MGRAGGGPPAPFTLTNLPLVTTGTTLRGEQTYPARFTVATGRDDGTFPVTTVVRWIFTPASQRTHNRSEPEQALGGHTYGRTGNLSRRL